MTLGNTGVPGTKTDGKVLGTPEILTGLLLFSIIQTESKKRKYWKQKI